MYSSGDFSFIVDDMWRTVLALDYASITPAGWKALKMHDSSKSFMWDTNGGVWTDIRSKLYNGHSAASESCSLRTMESIAKKGWDVFVKDFMVHLNEERGL
jgi:hypothetical protein